MGSFRPHFLHLPQTFLDFKPDCQVTRMVAYFKYYLLPLIFQLLIIVIFYKRTFSIWSMINVWTHIPNNHVANFSFVTESRKEIYTKIVCVCTWKMESTNSIPQIASQFIRCQSIPSLPNVTITGYLQEFLLSWCCFYLKGTEFQRQQWCICDMSVTQLPAVMCFFLSAPYFCPLLLTT